MLNYNFFLIIYCIKIIVLIWLITYLKYPRIFVSTFVLVFSPVHLYLARFALFLRELPLAEWVSVILRHLTVQTAATVVVAIVAGVF